MQRSQEMIQEALLAKAPKTQQDKLQSAITLLSMAIVSLEPPAPPKAKAPKMKEPTFKEPKDYHDTED